MEWDLNVITTIKSSCIVKKFYRKNLRDKKWLI